MHYHSISTFLLEALLKLVSKNEVIYDVVMFEGIMNTQHT